MAKVVHKNNNINDIFYVDSHLSIRGGHTRAVYEDGMTAGKLVLVGSNLTRDGNSEYLSGGWIKQVLITDENNQFAFKLTGAGISAKDLPHNYTSGDLTGLLSTILDGRDKIVGGTYNDYLYGYGGRDRINGKTGDDDITGGRGNDVLTGGPGKDTFHFNPSVDGKGHDVITDFDVFGSDIDHLHIQSTTITKVVDKGQDTLLRLGDGSTILLEDVRIEDLQAYWPNA